MVISLIRTQCVDQDSVQAVGQPCLHVIYHQHHLNRSQTCRKSITRCQAAYGFPGITRQSPPASIRPVATPIGADTSLFCPQGRHIECKKKILKNDTHFCQGQTDSGDSGNISRCIALSFPPVAESGVEKSKTLILNLKRGTGFVQIRVSCVKHMDQNFIYTCVCPVGKLQGVHMVCHHGWRLFQDQPLKGLYEV